MKNTKLENKIDRIERLLASMDKTLAINTKSLEEHVRRTNLLEKELAPVTKHVQQMQGAAKLIGVLALIATILSIFSFAH